MSLNPIERLLIRTYPSGPSGHACLDQSHISVTLGFVGANGKGHHISCHVCPGDGSHDLGLSRQFLSPINLTSSVLRTDVKAGSTIA